MLTEEQEEIIFSGDLIEQKEKVEQESILLQSLIDSEIPDTSFMWCSDSNKIIITDDVFRKTRRIREVDDDDDDDDDDDHYIRLKFDLHASGSSKTSLPKKTTVFEIDGTESESESSVPDNVIYEIKGNESPPSFVPYNYVHHHNHTHQIQMHKIGGKKHITTPVVDVLDNSDVLDNNVVPDNSNVVPDNSDVQGSQTPEDVSWGSECPKIPWSQQKEHHLVVPLNLVPIQLPGE
jgi:hypothetical protein